MRPRLVPTVACPRCGTAWVIPSPLPRRWRCGVCRKVLRAARPGWWVLLLAGAAALDLLGGAAVLWFGVRWVL